MNRLVMRIPLLTYSVKVQNCLPIQNKTNTLIMKKLTLFVFITLLVACNNQEKIKKAIETLGPEWDATSSLVKALPDKINGIQSTWNSWEAEMQIKNEWKARLGADQLAQLNSQIESIKSQGQAMESLTKEVDEFTTQWEAKDKTMAELSDGLSSGNIPKDAQTKITTLQSLIGESKNKIPAWEATLDSIQASSQSAYEAFSKLVVTIDPNLVDCNNQPLNLTDFLNNYAKKIEAEPAKWRYSRVASEFKDCSGMFLRLCESLGEKSCKGYKYPDRAFHDTRALAGWYHENGNLTLIKDAENSDHLIQPGMVMFYGYGDRPIPENFTVADLSAPYPNGLIEHVGTVTKVEKDENGKVTDYYIYHGRSGTKPAARTRISAGQNPVYSNWGQPWLAIGFIMTPES